MRYAATRTNMRLCTKNTPTRKVTEETDKPEGNMVKVTSLTEKEIEQIGEAFADYTYKNGEEGMAYLFGCKENVKEYICGYARAMIKAGFLYSTSEKHEAYVAYRYSKDKIPVSAGMELMKAIFKTIGLGGGIRMLKIMKRGGGSYEDKFKKTKKPYIFVGMLVVCKQYQGQGFMRKALEIAFKEGEKRHCPVMLDTDAELKRDKYVHLGMSNIRTRKIDEGAYLYDLVKEN